MRRAYLDIKQKDLSEIIGISSARISGLLSDPDTLTIARLRKIIEVLSPDPIIVLEFLGYDQKTIKRILDHSAD